MPRIFNSIRKRLLTGGRFGDYLLYAIGEIALVVVGILIALQVNTWNNSRQERKLEHAILREMRENLEKDLAMNRQNMEINELRREANSRVLEHLEQRTPLDSTLRRDYANIMGRGISTPNTSALDRLREHGFGLIRNDSLRRAISALYLERYPFIEREEAGLDEYYHNQQILPLVKDHLRTHGVFVDAEPRDLEALYKDETFHEALRLNVQLRAMMGWNHAQNVERIEALMAMIDRELKDH